MRELVGVAILIASLFGGTVVIKGIHDSIRRVALEKAAHGLPSLVEMNRTLRSKTK
ncbi:MAG: hypothetical protein KDD22_02865 [Bdellovibrionales bacterium]|nr:hypothetical protein [Bdellovibrionales bacterium]